MSDQFLLPFEGSDKTAPPKKRSRKGGGGRKPPPGSAPPAAPPPKPVPIQPVALHEAARVRYLNYALSVITARALPDVRDGLKPVQRRILYAMLHNLRLTPDSRYRKSAAVVGEVMAKYHPHGDSSIYDAMVRMAQDFSLRDPLVDGHGNFGSLDGDPPAAMRYTEARLRPLAIKLLEELKQRTVHHRANYDGTLEEPVVLPAQYPNLLVNGTTGIAVGMATNIPPHNLGEVIDASIALIDEPDLTTAELCGRVCGPDFPVGGQITTPPEDLVRIYDQGEGPIRTRGEYKPDPEAKNHLLITSLPYGVNKAQLIESIAEHIVASKIPQLLDVRDESTDEIRVVLELKRGASPAVVMAYLYKNTALETTFHVNMTCLIPSEKPEIGSPQKLNLKQLLRHFLDFRMEIVTNRLRYELEQVKKRIHILEGFERIFDELDEAIRIIRASSGKSDAAQKLMARFFLDELQADAVLETKLYRLSKLEIESIRKELAELRAREERLYQLLGDSDLRWEMIRRELSEVKEEFSTGRRTRVGIEVEHLEFDPAHYVIKEEAYVIVTRDGWIKRQKSFSDVSAIRVREGDSIGWVYPTTTQDTVAFFTNLGFAYVLRVDETPSTTGYGEPVQRQFQFKDQERVVGVVCFDPRCLPLEPEERKPADSGGSASDEGSGASAQNDDADGPSSGADSDGPIFDKDSDVLAKEDDSEGPTPDDESEGEDKEAGNEENGNEENGNEENGNEENGNEENGNEAIDGPFGVAITRGGKGLRFPLSAHSERSTKVGRRFVRLDARLKDDAVVAVVPCAGDENVSLVTEERRAIVFQASDLNILRGAGKGVTAIKLQKGDRVSRFMLTTDPNTGIVAETNRGRSVVVSSRKYHTVKRGGRGTEIIKRGSIKLVPQEPVVVLREESEQ